MTFRNTEYAKDLALNIKSAWCDKKYCDVTVKVGDIELEAHKLVLSAHSKYFQTEFETREDPSRLTVEDVDQDAMEACMEYMYSGEILLTEDTAPDVLQIANLLIMTNLFDFCVNYMQQNMTAENCLQARRLSYLYQIKTLRKASNSFAAQNLHRLSTHNPEFLELPKEDVIMFMYMQPHHNISFDAAICWLKFNLPERQDHVFELMKQVKFKRFTDAFANHVIASEDINLLDQKSVVKFGKKSPVFGYEAVMKWVKSSVEKRIRLLPQMLADIDLDHIPEDYVKTMMNTSDFKHFDKASLMKLCIGQKTSTVVFECVMTWVKHDVTCRSALLPTMLRIVDFSKFTDAYIRQILTSKDLKILNKKSLIQLLRSQNSPLLAYCSAIKWVKAEYEVRKPMLKDVFQNIRLENLPWKYLDENVRPQLVELESVDCLNMLLKVMTTIAQDHRKINIVVFDKKDNMIKGYDHQSAQWTNMPFNENFQKFTALVLHEQLYIVHGQSLHRLEYDVTQKPVWREMANMNEDRGAWPRVTVKSGYLYASGGSNASNTAEYYDPLRDKWTYIASMKTKRCQHAVVAVNDQLYAIGGWDGNARLNTVERLENGAWSFVTPMNKTRSNVAAVEHNELIYVIGGNGSDKTQSMLPLQTVVMYDPVCDLWTPMPRLKVPRYNFCACVVEAKIYAVAGDDMNGKDRTIEVFDFERNHWQVLEKLKDVTLEQTSVVIKIEEGVNYEESPKG